MDGIGFSIGASPNGNIGNFSFPSKDKENALRSQWSLWQNSDPVNNTLSFDDWSKQMSLGAKSSFDITGNNTNFANNSSVANSAASPNVAGTQNTTTPVNAYSDIYNKDLASLEMNKKYLIGNAIGQGILNTANLSQAFAKRPAMVGIGNIPNVEYPNISAPMIADLNASIGKYRSGIMKQANEQGLSPEMRIGAEANVLNSDLTQRAKIAGMANENKIGEINANSTIGAKNIENQYAAKIADQQRMDAINQMRSGLVTQGLKNIGKIGTYLTEGLSKSNTQEANLSALNEARKSYDAAVAAGQTTLDFAEYLKTYYPMDANGNIQFVGTNTPTTTKEQGIQGQVEAKN